jgi:hypothetical protein
LGGPLNGVYCSTGSCLLVNRRVLNWMLRRTRTFTLKKKLECSKQAYA